MADKKRTSFMLGLDEALVLFEMLADFHSQSTLDIRDSAQRLALIRLSGALESVLVEPFAADYRSTLEAARSRLVDQFGAAQG